MRYLAIVMILLLLACSNKQPEYEIIITKQETSSTASLRGLSVIDENTAWASGANGTVLRTIDGGTSWHDVSVPGADSVDFRDIEGLEAEEAIILSAGSPGLIYKTIDGGNSWQLVHEDKRPEIFFDAMDFWDSKSGIAFSDAIDGQVVIISTNDYGESWQTLPGPDALPGEGGFAASGTCLTTGGDSKVWIALGTPNSRVMYSADRGKSWEVFNTPMAQDVAGAGIFSLAFSSAEYGIAVGGNYMQPNDSSKVISYTEDGGKTWQLLDNSGVNGYKSAIANIKGSENWLCAGPTGVNFSSDNGKKWIVVDTTAYHTIQILKSGEGWLSGSDGQIARIKILNKSD